MNPKDKVNDYVIERLISNAGGMSKVFLACEADRPQHKVVLKVALKSQAASSLQIAHQDLLRDETDILRDLRHPNIVHIYPQYLRQGKDASYTARVLSHPERPWYYAMEYIEGQTLEKEMRRISKFPLEWKVEMFYQVLTTIHFMHALGYAHCDLKPANIVFREAVDKHRVPRPVLIDFGSASPVARIKDKIATVRYASPEIVYAMESSDPLAHRHISAAKVDIWELGVLFYEIMTGKPLFDGSEKQVKTTILRGEIKRMANRRTGISDTLDKVLARMLLPRPDKRPTTRQLIAAFEEHIYSMRPPRVATKS